MAGPSNPKHKWRGRDAGSLMKSATFWLGVIVLAAFESSAALRASSFWHHASG